MTAQERRRRDARLVRLRRKGLTYAAVARRMAREGISVSAGTVATAVRRDEERRAEAGARLQLRIWRPLRAQELWNLGWPLDRIAEEVGVCGETVRSYVQHLPDYPRGQRVLTERNRRIHHLRQQGLSLAAIGELFPHADGRPLTRQRVSQVVHRVMEWSTLVGTDEVGGIPAETPGLPAGDGR